MARNGERVERSSGAAPPRPSGESDSGGGPNGELLTFRTEIAGQGTPVVLLAGELDLSTIPIAERRLFEQLRSHRGIVVDLTELSFIDSSGIGMLIQAFRATEDGGAMHTVVAPGSQVDRVFRLAGIDRALPLYVDRGEAIAALNGADPRP